MPKLKNIFFLPFAVLCASSCMAQTTPALVDRGMVVVRDAESGSLRMPTAAEQHSLKHEKQQGRQQKQSAAIGAHPAQPALNIGPGGSRSVRVGERYMAYSVVTRNSEGGLDQHCVNGAHAGDTALAPANGSGKHDHASH